MTEAELSALQALCDAAPVIEDYDRFDHYEEAGDFYEAAHAALPALIAAYRFADGRYDERCKLHDKDRADIRMLRARLSGPGFDEEPDAPLHGECTAEIIKLRAENQNLRYNMSEVKK